MDEITELHKLVLERGASDVDRESPDDIDEFTTDDGLYELVVLTDPEGNLVEETGIDPLLVGEEPVIEEFQNVILDDQEKPEETQGNDLLLTEPVLDGTNVKQEVADESPDVDPEA